MCAWRRDEAFGFPLEALTLSQKPLAYDNRGTKSIQGPRRPMGWHRVARSRQESPSSLSWRPSVWEEQKKKRKKERKKPKKGATLCK